MSLERGFGVELAILAQVCGAGAEERLKRKILSVMSSVETPRPASETLQLLQTATTSDEYLMAGSAAHGKFNTWQKVMGRIVDMRALELEDVQQDDMLKEAVARLHVHVFHEVIGSSQEGGGRGGDLGRHRPARCLLLPVHRRGLEVVPGTCVDGSEPVGYIGDAEEEGAGEGGGRSVF